MMPAGVFRHPPSATYGICEALWQKGNVVLDKTSRAGSSGAKPKLLALAVGLLLASFVGESLSRGRLAGAASLAVPAGPLLS